MELSSKKGIQHIIMTLATLGLKEVIICPGSRNAPLTISMNRHPHFHCTSIRDERSAAFYALGKAIETQQAVAIICTSGSAALNFAPAICEAFYQRIPLIVLTADRPVEWIDQGDGQTIRQVNVYQNFIRKSYNINGDATSSNELWHIAHSTSEGFQIATKTDKGPVHFNIPVSEPLYDIEEIEPYLPLAFTAFPIQKSLSDSTIQDLAKEFSNSSKVMILVGQHIKDENLQEQLSLLSRLDNLVILTESTSNIHHPDFIENIDRCITHLDSEDIHTLLPDLLITIGGAIISKRIKSLIRKYKPHSHWNIDEYDAFINTYQSLTSPIHIKAIDFFKQIFDHIENNKSDYRVNWQKKKEVLQKRHQQFSTKCDYSDFKVFEQIYLNIPSNISLHLSNSSPIRYAQLFDNKNILETWSNRGTSGIDGCTSTVMGAASSSPEKDFLLITGDVSFHYDINALWNESPINNLKIIVINNGGGGIFRIISGPNAVKEMKPFFETTMNSNVEKLAEHYQWNYLMAKDVESLQEALHLFFKKETRRTILEIFTDAEKNPLVLEQYWNYLKSQS
ncbi:MAG: 2-succinyl-5-enolpyruvyl-6-hydroxy-3-cyclohexene-1-carboxylic-acid synthase [Chitinophagales bacterium]|nr:2-succinyl-5-enolpyruvyl-6-hydroxy-3-cyclohexene-1-carboxylic-acid synthase [Chitinophagales bacterium]MCZ2394691.1 2-succinyl-5-enolpyruvyl-6-hydroxy-3-cyclohexene-1-carboxylic-acid synthase [Chitinophagales bacterium]